MTEDHDKPENQPAPEADPPDQERAEEVRVDDGGDQLRADADHVEGDEAGQPRRGVRQRLAEAEAEVQRLQGLLDRQREAALAAELERVKLDPRLLAAAGHDLSSLIDTESGLLSHDAVRAAVEATLTVFPLSRAPRPDPLQGREPTTMSGPTQTLGDALKAVTPPRRGA